MDHWHPNRQGPDYCCEFCGGTEPTSYGPVHRKDCAGEKIMKIMYRID